MVSKTGWNSRAALRNETHFILSEGDELVRLCDWAWREGYYLCTLAANDERLLEDGVFKLYYVLSDPANQLVIVEHPLKSGRAGISFYPRGPFIRPSGWRAKPVTCLGL